MSTDIIKLPYRHSKKLVLGIDIFTLNQLFERGPDIRHLMMLPHRLEFYVLIYITSGKGSHIIDFQSYDVGQDTLIIVSRNQVHQFDSRLNLEGYIIPIVENFLFKSLFDYEKSISDLLFKPITRQAYVLENARSLLKHLERVNEEYQTKTDDAEQTPIIARELGILLLKAERLRRSQLPENELQAESSAQLIAFRRLLENHYMDRWTAQMYADQLGFSKKTLGAHTRKHLSCTPKEAIDQRLLLEAKRLLAYTDSPVKEIAYQLGFEDPANLNKFFRRVSGGTPTAFRDSVR